MSYVSRKTPKWAKLEAKGDDTEERLSHDNSATNALDTIPHQHPTSPNMIDDHDECSAMQALEEMTRSTGKYISKSKMLPRLRLSSTLQRDVTVGYNRNGAVKAVKFHPLKEVLITGADKGRISLFQFCHEDLSMKKGDFFLQDVQFDGFLLDSMDFFDEGRSLLVHSANRKYFYAYDLMEGKVSQIFLPQVLRDFKSTKMAVSSDGIYVAHVMGGSDLYVFNLATMEHLHTFRAGSKLVDVFFFPGDRNMIYALAQNGAVYEWDMTRRAEQSQFYDEGCVQATCASVSPNGQFIACGSNTGIVNVYEMHSAFGKSKKEESGSVSGEPTWNGGAGESPKPLYSLPNLTTSALFLRFNPDAQMMAFGSSVKFMAGRVLHCRSGDVFQNFPARQEMFEKERFKCAEFSPNSAFLAMGMETGGTRLYRLHHFERY